MLGPDTLFAFFFFNDTATTEIYTLSLHDALPIYLGLTEGMIHGHAEENSRTAVASSGIFGFGSRLPKPKMPRSEEHTSELQSHLNLVCRLLLEKKKKTRHTDTT